ncbi:MAG: hypothetical protein D6702_13015 [Planctomycetota bacterium]|nr:MAG: hypothetical protein D6702_13015 [Planctomycetota bacterium]
MYRITAVAAGDAVRIARPAARPARGRRRRFGGRREGGRREGGRLGGGRRRDRRHPHSGSTTSTSARSRPRYFAASSLRVAASSCS